MRVNGDDLDRLEMGMGLRGAHRRRRRAAAEQNRNWASAKFGKSP
jgi:hypothetical protein